MREGIGSTFLYNLIIIFLVIVFAVIAATLMYYKAFRVNTRIATAIEKHEGYNDLAITEINRTLGSIGYMQTPVGDTCPSRNGMTLITPTTNNPYYYCIYVDGVDTEYSREGLKYDVNQCTICKRQYFSYGIVTYIKLEVPLFDINIKLPIYTKSNLIFMFSED